VDDPGHDEKTVRVDGTPAGLACDAGKSRAPFRQRPLPQRRPHSTRPSVHWQKRV